MKKSAIIIGSEGQDGKIAFDYLKEKGYKVIGIDRGSIRTTDFKWNKKTDITSKKKVFDLIKKNKPSEVYYLAAFHHSSENKAIDAMKLFENSYKTNLFSLMYFLEGIRQFSPKTRLFYAASSLIFGNTDSQVQNEKTPFNPNTIYGITKLDGLLMCRLYRNDYNIFAAVGILYNHESMYRSEKFISMKIIQGAIDIKKRKKKKLVVGDLSAEIDWGHAPDYVDAMHKILNTRKSDDFVVATGKKHTVRELIEITFSYLGLDWKKYVQENKEVITRKRKSMVGNYNKLKNETGWKPTITFKKMVELIIDQRKNI